MALKPRIKRFLNKTTGGATTLDYNLDEANLKTYSEDIEKMSTVFNEVFGDILISGGVTSGTALANTVSACLVYAKKNRVEQDIATSHTFTASKDTYVHLITTTGIYTFNEVANGAGAPALGANEVAILKVITNATVITSSTAVLSPSKVAVNLSNSSTLDDIGLRFKGSGENIASIDFDNAFGTMVRILGTKLGSGASADKGKLVISLATNSVLSDRITILNTGDMGLGISPTAKLHVAGTGLFTGNLKVQKATARLELDATTGTSSVNLLGGGVSRAFIGSVALSQLNFFDGPGTAKVTWDLSTNPGTLQVGNIPDARLTANIPLRNTENNFSVGQRVSGTVDTASSGGISLKYGLLAAIPSNSADSWIGVQNTGGPGGLAGDLIMGPRSSTGIASAIRMFTGQTTIVERLIIDTTGNVGIGVTPTAKLHVAGTGLFTGNLKVQKATARLELDATTGTSSVNLLGGGVSRAFVGSVALNQLNFFDGPGTAKVTWDLSTNPGTLQVGNIPDARLTANIPLKNAAATISAAYTFSTNPVFNALAIPDAALSANIPLLNAAINTFTGQVKIGGGVPGLNKVLTSDALGLATWEVNPTAPFQNNGNASGANRTLGNTDNFSLGFETNNINRLNITAAGDISVIGNITQDLTIKTATPLMVLDADSGLPLVLFQGASLNRAFVGSNALDNLTFYSGAIANKVQWDLSGTNGKLTQGDVPLARLDATAASSGYPQSGTGGETLRTLRGRVSATGVILQGTGFTVTKGASGSYTINFTTSFGSIPSISCVLAGSTVLFIGAALPLVSEVGISTVNSSVVGVDAEFSFIVLGPP